MEKDTLPELKEKLLTAVGKAAASSANVSLFKKMMLGHTW